MQAREGTDQCRFTRAVGSQQTHHFASMQRHINVFCYPFRCPPSPARTKSDGQVFSRYDVPCSFHQNEACKFLRCIITQITTGDPTSEVTALMGSVAVEPGIRATRSQVSSNSAPIKSVPGMSTLCSFVPNSERVKWGTAIPMNPIGPVKAVMPPANRLVLAMIHILVLETDRPMLRA